MLPLPFRLPLLPNESLPSLLARLCRLNGYFPSSILYDLALGRGEGGTRYTPRRKRGGDNVEAPALRTTYNRLCTLTKIEPVVLYNSSAQRFASVLMLPNVPVRSNVSHVTLPSCEGSDLGERSFPLITSDAMRLHLCAVDAAQFCPLCLSGDEEPYHRVEWMLQAVAGCLKHKCLLCSACPSCGGKVRLVDIVEARCSRCLASLTDVDTSMLVSIADDHCGLTAQKVIYEWFMGFNDRDHAAISTSTPGSFGMPDVDVDVLYRVVFALRHSFALTIMKVNKAIGGDILAGDIGSLGTWGNVQVRPWAEFLHRPPTPPLSPSACPALPGPLRYDEHNNYQGCAESGRHVSLTSTTNSALKLKLTPAENYALYVTAVKAMCTWPHGFHKCLSAYRVLSRASRASLTSRAPSEFMRHHRGSGRSLFSELGQLYTGWIGSEEWQHPLFRFVQDAFNLYVLLNERAASRPTQTRRYQYNRDLVRQFGYVTFAEAARSLNTDRATIERLARAGRLVVGRLSPEAGEDANGPLLRSLLVRRAELDVLLSEVRDDG